MQAKLDQYKIFKAVADNHNISLAAKKMYISQSAISQTIKSLEKSLGVRLFVRTKKGVALTYDGKTLYEYIAPAISLIESGEARLNENKDLTHGELSIGISNTLVDCFLLPYLQKYHKLYPGIKVNILNGTSKHVMNYLDSGRVDICFATTNEKPANYDSTLCFRTNCTFVASPDYPIDFDKIYSIEEISRLPLIMLEREAGSRRFLENCFLKKGIHLVPEIELSSYELLISLAGIGLGVAGITEEFSHKALDRNIVKKLKLDFELPQRAVSMLTIKNTEPSMAARKFKELIN